MALNLEALLAPVAGEDPAGPDLYDDPQSVALKETFDRPLSVDTTGAEPIQDWRTTLAQIESLSRKTKDIWLPVYMCRAGARSGQLAVVELGAQYLAGLVETYWNVMHPKLDEFGFVGRKTPCESLAKIAEFLTPIRRLPLLESSRFGRFSGADFERFRSGGDAEDGFVFFSAALEEAGEAAIEATIARIDRITEALRRVDSVLMEHAEGDTGANLNPTYDAFAQLRAAIAAFKPAGAMPAPATDATPLEPVAEAPITLEVGPTSTPKSPPNAPIGGLKTREDVLRALDAIADYYRREEPASPVPLVLQRARDWVQADFLTLLKDIAPSSLDEALRVLVSSRKDDEPS